MSAAQPEFDFDAKREERKEATKEILARIKKLLRLGRSSNPHEAELAMQRAFELAEKYRVDVESLDLDDAEAAVVHEWFQVGQRLSFLKKAALNILVMFFHVNVCISTPRVVFVGRATDVAIAHYVFEFLIRACTRCLRVFESGERASRRKINHSKRTSFISGFIYGIASKLRDSRSQHALTDAQAALVAAEDVARKTYLEKLIPNQRTVALEGGSQHRTAIEAGYIQGKATNINTPLAGTPGGMPLLT